MLPHEFFIVLLSIALPIGLTVLIIMLSRIVKSVDTLKSEVTTLSRNDVSSEGSVAMLADLFREHRAAIAAQVEAQVEATTQLIRLNQEGRALAAPAQASGTDEAMTLLAQLFREHREAVAAQLEAQASATAQLVQVTRDSRDGIVDELRSQRVLSQEITQELSQIAQSRTVAPAPPGLDPSQRIDRMRALAEVLGLALNDLSMTATQVLTEHLNAAHGDRDGTRKFISTLTTAYFAGDKNVFFRSLVQEAVNRSEQLRRCAEDTESVRQQISKILREAREIRSLVAACDPNDLVRIVFEDGELWALEKALAEHFLIDGSPVWTETAPDFGMD
ncbi:liposome tubulation protein MamY [Magnetospirillum sp. XM-1]|uniref:liposome tubulation protein MamY n=1 Tax=Magnetospirillum sp. XM-1 TaxID=1663591 RepID=UPI001E305708|nr:liposome tubulation protein MamY [Magnetospirillum sp. XM-1]